MSFCNPNHVPDISGMESPCMKHSTATAARYMQKAMDIILILILIRLQCLHVVESLVIAVEGNEFLMLTSFDYLTLMHYTDFVCILDC